MTKPERPSDKRGPYRKSVILRREILDAALVVFGRDGYRSGSVREIAKLAGITAPGVLHHFGTKSALLIEALRHREAVDREFSAGHELRGVGALLSLVRLAERNASQRGVVELFSVLSAEATSPEHPAHAYFQERYAWFREYLGGAFELLAQTGSLRPGVTPHIATRSTIAMMDGLQVQWLLDPGSVDMPGDLAKYFRTLVTEDAWTEAVRGPSDGPAPTRDTEEGGASSTDGDAVPGGGAGPTPAAAFTATARDVPLPPGPPAVPPVREPTIQDIAKDAGVSIASVSRALNGKPGVAAATRETVLDAARRLGFTGNATARALKSGRTGRIAVTLPWLATEYTARILSGIAEVLEEHGQSLAIGTTHGHRGRVRPVLEQLGRHGFDGAILVLPPGSPKEYAASATAGKPVVVVDPAAMSDLPTVVCDNVGGAASATRHLLESGHRRIGIVAGEPDLPATVERLEGVRAALAETGIGWDPTLVRHCTFTAPAGAFEAALSLVDTPDPPTAIFALNDRLAARVLAAARSRGLDVPRQLAVIGFDDDELASLVAPLLTTVRQPSVGLGAAAARLLLECLGGRDRRGARVLLPTELVVRESTCRFV
ncbi:substrate-binding domain-containing protein [Streptomyces sp. NPDC055103]